jgi:predicted HTH domain antitoxin
MYMNTVTLELKLPQETYVALQSAGLSREDLGLRATRDFAVQLYADGRLSLGKAAAMAGLSLSAFWLLLLERGVPVFKYTEDDYQADLNAVRNLMAKNLSLPLVAV